jgi:hypothetical protein
LNWNLFGRSRVEKRFEKELFTATGRWTGRCIGRGSASPPRPVSASTSASGHSRSFFFETSNRTLHRTCPCRPPRPVPVITTVSSHPFQVSGQNLTGRCQRPIVDNRTRSVIPGAYWNVTGRCLHRVRSFDHRIWSSREKRISTLLNRMVGSRSLSRFSSAAAILAIFVVSSSSRARRPHRSRALAPLAHTKLHHRRARTRARAEP